MLIIYVLTLLFLTIINIDAQVINNLDQPLVFKWEDEVVDAFFINEISSNGWCFLTINTKLGDFTNDQIANSSGFAEGYLTAKLIYQHWQNTKDDICSKEETCQKLWAWINKQHDWVDKQRVIYPNNDDPYWLQVHLVHHQIGGLALGYQASGEPQLPEYAFDFLQLVGDMDELNTVINGKNRLMGSGSCSALIKHLEDKSDILFSHVTWNSYNTMLRIIKKYYLPYKMTSTSSQTIPGTNMTFSSYPGTILSIDDFYTLNTNLTLMETTNGNFNKSLLAKITPSSIMEFTRVLVANRLAKTGRDWVEIFSRYNSGTYNNQWMVLDYNKFQPGEEISNETFYVLEQLPGLIRWEDLSYYLRTNGYWSSYNIPFFPEIYSESGVLQLKNKYGDFFSHENAPRAKMFRRGIQSVKDIESLRNLMRYNDFMNDPFAKCNCTPPYSGENGISARSDLNPENGSYPFSTLGHRYHGGTDVKITGYKLLGAKTFIAECGPTFAPLPPFQWSKSGVTPSLGQPDLFKFAPVVVSEGNQLVI